MNRLQHLACGVIATIVAGSFVVLASPPSFADGAAVAAAGATAERATGTSDIADSRTTATAAAETTTRTAGGDVNVSIPATSTGSVETTAADGTTVALGLPETREVQAAKSDAGTVSYADAAPSTDVAVQPTTDGGVRALVTLKDAGAPTKHRFDIKLPEGTELVATEDGGYDIVRDSEAAVSFGHINAPWARDAGGHAVPTSYRLDGTTLVQTVHVDAGTRFPVVADPKYTWGWATGTVYYKRAETKRMRDRAGILSLVTFLTPASIPFGLVADEAKKAYAAGKCLKIRYPVPFVPGTYKDSYCK